MVLNDIWMCKNRTPAPCVQDSGEKFAVWLCPVMSPSFMSPCWHVRASSEKSECNMVIKNLSSAHAWSFHGDKGPMPHMENTAKVSAGDELIVYRPELKKAAAAPEALQDVKRRRTGKVSGS